MARPALAQDTLLALRRQIARIEGTLPVRLGAGNGQAVSEGGKTGERTREARIPTGIGTLDRALGGGMPRAGLAEIHAPAMRDAGSSAGLALAFARRAWAAGTRGPLLWIATSEVLHEAGRPYAPGLCARFGLLPEHLLLAEAGKTEDALWIAEEATALGLFRAINLEIRGHHRRLDLTATRRLHLRALAAGHPLFLLRQAAEAEPTAAPVRLLVSAAPAGPRFIGAAPFAGSIGPPAFRLTVSKSPTAIPASLTMEWIHDAFQERASSVATDHRPLVSLPAVGADPAPAVRTVVAFPHAGADAAPGLQPSRGQYPAHRRA